MKRIIATLHMPLLLLSFSACGENSTTETDPSWPPPPMFCSYSVNALDEAIKAVSEKDYYRILLKKDGGWLSENGVLYHGYLLDALKDLGCFPAVSCYAEHEKNPTEINETNGMIEFSPSEYGRPSIAYYCGCHGYDMTYELCILNGEYEDVTSVIDYFSVAYGTTPEEKGWTRIELTRSEKTVTAVQQIIQNEGEEHSHIRFIEDGLCITLYNGAIADAESVEIIKTPYPEEPFIVVEDFLGWLRLGETTYTEVCEYVGTTGTLVEPRTYEWTLGYMDVKILRLHFGATADEDLNELIFDRLSTPMKRRHPAGCLFLRHA